jgi:hypothetical protein
MVAIERVSEIVSAVLAHRGVAGRRSQIDVPSRADTS